eukprot:CAMPEP_0196728848 /NCGR_PEP_ID=MMETSP1091-20130531/9409_1 /TAXON_ID=302021 /ORGANISM="Rhodomonas sp., Strain CCMP768" /LENGTH=82 /DNA_ID=CAMNT_0042071651 /DNA_START=24 /DNA_END=272 /DNA_ORIENTATION=-
MFATIRQAHDFLQFQNLQLTEAAPQEDMLSEFSLSDYATAYTDARTAYLNAAQALKLASGPYKAARDAYVAAAATYTKSLYE